MDMSSVNTSKQDTKRQPTTRRTNKSAASKTQNPKKSKTDRTITEEINNSIIGGSKDMSSQDRNKVQLNLNMKGEISTEEAMDNQEFSLAHSSIMKPIGENETDLEKQVMQQKIQKEVAEQLDIMFGDKSKPKFKVNTLI
jgi:hypothetical protein